MDINIDEQGRLSILSVLTPLRGAQPVMNGTVLSDARAEIVEAGPNRWFVRYTAAELGEGVFGLEIWKEGERLALIYWLQGLPADRPLEAIGLRFAVVENLRQYLCSGYFSWDGSFYVQPEGLADFAADEPRPETGYALTQLLPRAGTGSLVLGFDRPRPFPAHLSLRYTPDANGTNHPNVVGSQRPARSLRIRAAGRLRACRG